MNENTQELVTATKHLLQVVENIRHTSLNEFTLAWERADKAIRVLEAMEQEEPPLPESETP